MRLSFFRGLAVGAMSCRSQTLGSDLHCKQRAPILRSTVGGVLGDVCDARYFSVFGRAFCPIWEESEAFQTLKFKQSSLT